MARPGGAGRGRHGVGRGEARQARLGSAGRGGAGRGEESRVTSEWRCNHDHKIPTHHPRGCLPHNSVPDQPRPRDRRGDVDAMTRSVPEWIGKTPDARIPWRVMLRVFMKHDGICPKCTRKLQPDAWACDHIVALVNGGEHRESNLQPLCTSPCHSQKTSEDVAEKSRVARKAKAHVGLATKRSKLQSRGFAKAPRQNNASRPVDKWRGF